MDEKIHFPAKPIDRLRERIAGTTPTEQFFKLGAIAPINKDQQNHSQRGLEKTVGIGTGISKFAPVKIRTSIGRELIDMYPNMGNQFKVVLGLDELRLALDSYLEIRRPLLDGSEDATNVQRVLPYVHMTKNPTGDMEVDSTPMLITLHTFTLDQIQLLEAAIASDVI